MTDGGANTGFILHIVSADQAATLRFWVYEYNSSELIILFSFHYQRCWTTYFVPFALFSGNADFSNVGAIVMQIDGSAVPSLDISIDFMEAGASRDFGDLPADYNNTVEADGGANHVIGSLFLGAGVDSETDGQESPLAAGDDNDLDGDDETGVVLADLPWSNGPNGGAVQVTSNGSGCLYGWIDFTSNNSLGDDYVVQLSPLTVGNEKIINGYLVSEGAQTIPFDVPFDLFGGASNFSLNARFRLVPDYDGDSSCSDQYSLTPFGIGYNGGGRRLSMGHSAPRPSRCRRSAPRRPTPRPWRWWRWQPLGWRWWGRLSWSTGASSYAIQPGTRCRVSGIKNLPRVPQPAGGFVFASARRGHAACN